MVTSVIKDLTSRVTSLSHMTHSQIGLLNLLRNKWQTSVIYTYTMHVFFCLLYKNIPISSQK